MIELHQVKFTYKEMQMCFDLQLARGEKAAVIGESGAGKSTLLNLIAGFEYADSGRILLNGEDHSRSAVHQRPVSMLFQENNLFTHLTVEQNIALGLKPNLSLNTTERQLVVDAAAAVGLGDFLKRQPTALSGGQKQRVALARCLLRDKPILLLDEPFSALDPQLRQEMQQLIFQLCDEKQLTLLLVTHQPQEISQSVDLVLRLHNGRILDN